MLPGVARRGRAAAHLTGQAQIRAASYAVTLTFAGAGLFFASWAARIPQIRDALRVSPGVLGLLLLCGSAGAVVATPLSGLVISRLGEIRTVVAMSLLAAAGLATLAVGYHYGTAAVAVGLLLAGYGGGTWDIAMNVQGAAVEQALGRAVMPRFHAGWSIGTVAGAALGAMMVAAGVPVTVHLLAVAVLTAVAMPLAAHRFLPPAGPAARHGPAGRRSPLAAWTERRTLLIGLFVLCVTFTEGVGNDWLSLAVIDGYRAAVVLGTVTFALFLAAMTAGRWFGPRLIDRYGRVRVLRGCAVTALAGLLLIVAGPVLPVAMAGAVLMGLGTSLGFPVGLSAAADDPRYAPGRVSTAGSIGYLAFLTGPPVIGFLGDHIGVRSGLSAAAVLLVAAFFLCPAAAPLRPPGQEVSRPGEPAPAGE